MSFKSILLKIESVVGKVLGGVVAAEPTVETILPVFGPLAAGLGNLVFGVVNSVETLITGTEQGQAKKDSALAILQAQAPNLEALVSLIGKDVKLSPAQLNALGPIIDSGVAFANALAAFEASVTPSTAAKPAA